MARIGQKTRDQVVDQVQHLLEDYKKELHEAYMNMGKDPLTVSLKAKISPDNRGNKVETNMSFVTGVKDKITGSVNEDQMELFSNLKWKPRLPLTIYPRPRHGRPGMGLFRGIY